MSTYELLNEMNELMTLGFGKPSVHYCTPGTKDLLPSYWTKWTEEKGEDEEAETVELGYKCVARTVGIAPEDIKISIEDYGLLLEGETEVEGSTYSQSIKMPISKEVMNNLEAINYKTENGLTRIYLRIKTPEYKKIAINQI